MTSSGPSLPILQTQDDRPHPDSLPDNRRSGRWAILVHATRMLLLALVIMCAYGSQQRRLAKARKPIESEAMLSFAQGLWPSAARCIASNDDDQLVEVVDANEKLVGKLATTSPLADSIVGYAGPSNVILGISIDGTVQRVELVHSSDTADHVLMVRNDATFWKQFEDRDWAPKLDETVPDDTESNATTQKSRPDGVSGATLTSLAIAESILLRIEAAQGTRPTTKSIESTLSSLKFADPLTHDEAKPLVAEASKQFPEQWDAQQVTLATVSPWELSILDRNSKIIGRVLRSGPLADQILGYQGPSEVLLCMDSDQTLLAAVFRGTYDNQPYSRYVKEEASYWSKFEGRKLSELATIDLSSQGIDGVSGATMTSLAIAETIQESCKRLIDLEKARSTAIQTSDQIDSGKTAARARWWNLSWNELFTIAIASIALPWSRFRYRGRLAIRLVWQAICFLGLGWVGGNMLSLSLFSGWAQAGVPWQLAPGLTSLLVIACVSNLLFKRNVYCDHLCPHGIAQQWLQKVPNSKRTRTASNVEKWIVRLLKLSGIFAISLATLQLFLGTSIPIAWLEPFDSYIWRIGFSWSILIWVASLAYSYFRPMAYCRHGCPTGMLLNYTRFNSSKSNIVLGDLALIILLVAFVAFGS